MTLPRDASDAALVARAAEGDHAALDDLWDRHAAAIHDHVARWTQDADLAAAATVAAFRALLDDMATGATPTAVRPRLLRTARAHATRVLADGVANGPAVPPATLAASGAAATTPEQAAAAWAAVVGLGAPWFSALDLTVRQGCGPADLAMVLDQSPAAVQELLDTALTRTDEATRAAYAALAYVPAPVTARTATAAAARARIGAPALLSRAVRLRALAAVGVLALVVLGVGLANALSGDTGTPTAGPATAAAEPVPSPSPSPSASVEASPTPTLEPLDSPSDVPTVAPEPTSPPSPTPSLSPSPSPTELAVTIDEPPSGATFATTKQDTQGRAAATVSVRATIRGASERANVVWTSDLGGGPLLEVGAGDLLLWLEESCTDATHTVTVTVTDPDGGQTATSSILVELLETCEEPPRVQIDDPADGQRIEARPPNGDGTRSVSVPVRATSVDVDLTWVWSVLAGDGSDLTVTDVPEGPQGTVEVVLEPCTPQQDEQSVVLQVVVTRGTDEATATDRVSFAVVCPPPG